MRPQKRRWQDMSSGQRAAMLVVNILRLSLTMVALWDLRRRPAGQINGPKRLWNLVVFINFIGPIAYFVFGHKRES